jgi:hypothetical protein
LDQTGGHFKTRELRFRSRDVSSAVPDRLPDLLTLGSHKSRLGSVLHGPLIYGGIATLTPMSKPQEPCSRCGEETAVGSTYYSDRRSTVGRDGTHAFLCQECLIEGHLNRRGKPRTDEDLELIAATGLLIGAAVLTGNA